MCGNGCLTGMATTTTPTPHATTPRPRTGHGARAPGRLPWHTWPFYARCSFRNWNDPDTRYTLVGLRLVRE